MLVPSYPLSLYFSSVFPLGKQRGFYYFLYWCLIFATEISQQCQEAGMPWEGKNSPQWLRLLLLPFVYLQLSGQGDHRGLICFENARILLKLSEAESVVN
ncbi:unnamed protein product [Eretmochelys imbricata]